jgi:5-(carboxyamino)imidazole ribonucleotide synthase
MTAILPPATIGILGGGQLGRMTALAARAMGYRVQVLDPDANCAASPVVERVIAARFDDAEAAAELASQCDVVTLEIEKIAPVALDAVAARVPLRPGAHIVRMVQHRGRQKSWLAEHGFPVGAYALVESAHQLAAAARDIGSSLYVKSSQGGYDGRSQIRFGDGDDANDAFAQLGGQPAVAEQALDLELELSVLVARRPSGALLVYPPALNQHDNQVLSWSVLPAELPRGVASAAQAIAAGIAEELRLEGILAVEMFLLRDGQLLVNELAPRPHNSYHVSELACPTSQFEQLVRTACDLPLGDAEPVRPAAIYNLFGELWENDRVPNFDDALAVPGCRLFLYGKPGARRGRKMGHLGAIGSTTQEALDRVRQAAARL